jgi:hypothetical protein
MIAKNIPTLDRYGLAGAGGQPSRTVTAYGVDADLLAEGRLVRFHDFRLQGSPARTVMCRDVERRRDGLAVADVLPVLGLVGKGGEVFVPAEGW